ncbi:hypothetical protein [Paenibacillus hunanensis]|uniref:Copper amine oxidase-like N-terminal domain-containing protein n=1 Tax=Paenibacillus hunanensis TaxID=539262 RepID=A0ABU1IV23_9BACL|nr:hypothetical protein [Paenibacillus hunanensis]MDR6243119.1 hypothetical protein [Paenibacillus hunanensis]GGJ11697.1 hypothetical protein GCM10008022_21060 [Paenibacillus hunanensis]
MRSKHFSVSIVIFAIAGLMFYSSAQNIHTTETITAATTAKSSATQSTKVKTYADYQKNAGWELGASFSDLLPKLNKMKYELPSEDKQYNTLIAFYDKNQRLIFESGILQNIITSEKGKGIPGVASVGDPPANALKKLGKPLTTLNTNGIVYYGYGGDVTDQKLTIGIKNKKVIEINLQDWIQGTPDENRAVLAYLNSIGDPAADYYVCNACDTDEPNSPTPNDTALTKDDMRNIFETISADMRAYTQLRSDKQTDYTKVFTEEQAYLEQRLDEAQRNSTGQSNQQIIEKLDIYCNLVYDAYSQKAMSLAKGISKYDKANYEQQAFTSITDAMTVYNEVSTYLNIIN